MKYDRVLNRKCFVFFKFGPLIMGLNMVLRRFRKSKIPSMFKERESFFRLML